MTEMCSVPTDWELPTGLVPPAQRRVECVPAEPVSVPQLVPLLEATAVVEVWVPLVRRQSNGSANGVSPLRIRDVWIEFADRVQAVRYESPGGGCPIAWYRALRPIETDGATGLPEAQREQYTRLSARFGVDVE